MKDTIYLFKYPLADLSKSMTKRCEIVLQYGNAFQRRSHFYTHHPDGVDYALPTCLRGKSMEMRRFLLGRLDQTRFIPNDVDDDSVTYGDDDGRNDEDCHTDQTYVQLKKINT